MTPKLLESLTPRGETPRSARRRPSIGKSALKSDGLPSARKKKRKQQENAVDEDDQLDAGMNEDERTRFNDQYVTTFRETFSQAAHKMILPADAKGEFVIVLYSALQWLVLTLLLT